MKEEGGLQHEPAELTLGRMAAFTELLCEFGLADAFDEARRRTLQRQQEATAEDEGAGPGPSTIAEQAQAGTGEDTAPDPDDLTVQLDMGRFYRAIGREGQLQRLGAILFDVTEQEAEAIPVDEMEDAFFLCSLRLGRLGDQLVASAGALA